MQKIDFRQNGLRVFLSYFKPHWKLFTLDMICAIGISVIDLIFPILSRTAMQLLLPNKLFTTFFLFQSKDAENPASHVGNPRDARGRAYVPDRFSTPENAEAATLAAAEESEGNVSIDETVAEEVLAPESAAEIVDAAEGNEQEKE